MFRDIDDYQRKGIGFIIGSGQSSHRQQVLTALEAPSVGAASIMIMKNT
jgi:hypothetical protein